MQIEKCINSRELKNLWLIYMASFQYSFVLRYSSVNLNVLLVFWYCCVVQTSLTDEQMWPDLTRSLELISTPSVRRWDVFPESTLKLKLKSFTLFIAQLNIYMLVLKSSLLCFYFFLCCLRLACWQYERTGISSWPKTLKKLTRPSSKRTSRSTSSTSRERVCPDTQVLLIFTSVCPYLHCVLWICWHA